MSETLRHPEPVAGGGNRGGAWSGQAGAETTAPEPPSPPSRDVEALLAEEVYGKETQKTREEVTAPLYTGAPLVPHSSDEAEPARGEDG